MNTKALILAFSLGASLHATADAPMHVRVWTQYIEVPHATLSGWLNGGKRPGHELHAEALKLAKGGGAKVLETNMVICRSGQRATVESIREEIYPTEYEPPELPGTFGSTPPTSHPLWLSPDRFSQLRPNTATAFETRNTGVTLEVEPTIGIEHSIIDLRLAPEIVTPLRLDTWMEHVDQWGDASTRMPAYETWRTNTSLMLVSGKFELASVITPNPNAPVPAVPRRILLFVRADVVTTPIKSP